MKPFILAGLTATVTLDVFIGYVLVTQPSLLTAAGSCLSVGATLSMIRDAIKLWHLES